MSTGRRDRLAGSDRSVDGNFWIFFGAVSADDRCFFFLDRIQVVLKFCRQNTSLVNSNSNSIVG
jgi:hypothetical protein